MCSTRKCLIVFSCLLIPVTAPGADFALSIDAPGSVTVSSEFDAVLRGTSINKRLIAYSALLDYDTTALSLVASGTGFSGTVWAGADFQSVTEEPGGRIRVAAVMELPSEPGGPSSIAPGQNLSFLTLRFSADAVGSNVDIGFAGTVDDNLLADEDLVGHDTANGLELTPATISVVDDVPEIDVMPLSLSFGEVLVGTSATRQIVVESAGLANLEVMSISLGSGTSNDFEIVSVPSLPAEFASGASFVVQVRYSPSNVGGDNGSLLIESDDADESTVTVSLSGSGVPEATPDIDVFPVEIDYGEISVGSSSNRNVRVRNFGSAPLMVTSIGMGAGGNDFLLNAVPGLPASVASGEELLFKVRYIPSDVGADSSEVLIGSDDSDEAVVAVPLSGVGLEVIDPEIDVSPASVDFGVVAVGDSTDTLVVITNQGSTALVVSALELSAQTGPDFSLSMVPALPASVASGGQLVVEVAYGPTAVGVDTGALVIASNDADEPIVSVPLSGEGVTTPAPEIDVSPLEFDFGRVEIGEPAALMLHIRNRGSLSLEIMALQLQSGSSPDFSMTGVPTLPHSIAPGEELVIPITYDPRITGFDAGSVLVQSSDADEGEITVSLVGFGIPQQKEGIVAHMPLNCSAEEIINDETGLALGTVRCHEDRFLERNRAVRFGDGGYVVGIRFPVVAGDFIVDAWILPEQGSDRSPAEIFVLHNKQASLDIPSLIVEWDDEANLVRVHRDSGESIEFGGLTYDWHHVLIAQRAGLLSLYVDGQLKGTVEGIDIVGGAYTLGASLFGTQAFHGSLDELILESGVLGEGGAIERALRGGPTVYVHPSERLRTIAVNPGSTVEALDLRLTGPNANGLELTKLALVARDVTPGEGDAPALDYLVNGRLVLRQGCDEESEIEVADLVVTSVDGGTATIELMSSQPVLFLGSDVCLAALFDLQAEAPLGQVIQFSIETLDDLEVVDSEGGVQYLAGERLVGKAALQSDQLLISDLPPPELELEFPSKVPTVSATDAVDGAQMHFLTLAAGASEGLKLLDVTYHAAEGTSLSGLTNARLFADLNSNGELDAGEDSHVGVIDAVAGTVSFSDTGIEVPAADEVDLVLLADLKFVEAPAEEGAQAAFFLPIPFSGPGSWMALILLAFSGALSLLGLRAAQVRPKFAGALALALIGCVFGFGVGCSGGGGGGGGGGKPATGTQSFQLVIASEDDIHVEGLLSATEPTLGTFPAGGIPGALYVIRQP